MECVGVYVEGVLFAINQSTAAAWLVLHKWFKHYCLSK